MTDADKTIRKLNWKSMEKRAFSLLMYLGLQ